MSATSLICALLPCFTKAVADPSLTDQIEFANVILLNKTDMMTKKQVDNVENLVKTLNPSVTHMPC